MGKVVCVVERNISVSSYTIAELVAAVEHGEFLIPTFQRDVLWRQDQIASLWDSMYRSFPIGSLIYWQTPEQLDLIREVGGHPISNTQLAAHTGVYNYILDGQQRLTAIFAAMMDKQGSIERDPDANYALYFDATADLPDITNAAPVNTHEDEGDLEHSADDGEEDLDDADEDEDDSAGAGDGFSDQELLPEKSNLFLYKKDANRRRSALAKQGWPQELVVRIAEPADKRAERIARLENQPKISQAVIERLKLLDHLLDGYAIPVERVSGVDRAEVCDIFMRINTAGRRADATDVIIATMFGGRGYGFDLRKMFSEIREKAALRQPGWSQIKPLTLMQMIGVCMREARLRDGEIDAHSYGVTSRQLLNLSPEKVKPYWDEIRVAIDSTISCLMSVGIYHPILVPSAYLPMPLAAHFMHRRQPDARETDLIAKWVWRSAFDSNSISAEKHIGEARAVFFEPIREGRNPPFPTLTIQRARLLENARPKSAIYKATLSFLSRLGPQDFDGGAFVTFNPDSPEEPIFGAPSIHHIYPKAFLEAQGVGTKTRHRNALMNMCLIFEATNQHIGNRNPVEYFWDYASQINFPTILRSHLIPERFPARTRFEKADYTEFLDARAAWFIEQLREKLNGVKVRVV